MSTIKRALIAVSLVVAATSAQAQDRGLVTTYIGGPKSGLTQVINNAGAKAVGSDSAYSSFAQVPVRSRVQAPSAGFSGAVRALGADSASYEQDVRPKAHRAVPARVYAGPTSGAKALGSDH